MPTGSHCLPTLVVNTDSIAAMHNSEAKEKQLEAAITSGDSSSISDGIIGDTEGDVKLERKIMWKRDFILLPTIGLLYMIVSAWNLTFAMELMS